MFDTIISDSTI